MAMNWDDPAERLALIERVGHTEYNRLIQAWIDANPIRPTLHWTTHRLPEWSHGVRFTLITVEKRLTVESDELASLWREWQATPERSGRERAAWDRIIEKATELAELEESAIDYVVDVERAE